MDVLPFHIASLVIAAVGILYADKLGFAWFRGTKETIDPKQLARAHWTVSIGLGLLVSTGIILFSKDSADLLQNSAFYVKMAFVLGLIINSVFIERFMHVATLKPFRALTRAERLPLFISGGASTLCWIGAAVAAFFL